MRGIYLWTGILLGLLWNGAAQAWQVHHLHPFVEATADQLPDRLGPAAQELTLTGLQNDWIHEGLAIATTGEERATVTVSLTGPEELRKPLRLRVVGFIEQKDIGYVLDPILDRPKDLELDRFKGYMRNFENIYEFPTVTATPQDPVALWITADTRNVEAGRYTGAVRVEGADGKRVEIPLHLEVEPYPLPLENPLVTFGWEWIPGAPTQEEGARLLLEYGINACHVDGDMEAARAAGFKFFSFVFGPSWKGVPPQQADEAGVDQRIAEIQAMIQKLNLQPHEWALYTMDEPCDETVPGQVEWCRYIKRKWPEARFVYNPAWGGDPQNPNVTVEGTLKPLLDCADVWLPYSWWVVTSIRKGGLELMQSTGKPVWFYEIMSHQYTRRPAVGREMMRTLAWVAGKHRLQGASWYALNACEWPWSSDPQGTGHGCIYGTIPGRGLEALRQGIQEYKRLYELRRLGVDEAELDGFAERVFKAEHVSDIDRVRMEMDGLLLRVARDQESSEELALPPDLRIFRSPTQKRWASGTMNRCLDRLMAPAREEFQRELEALKTPEDVRRYQEDIRGRLAEFFGRWPAKTPLNPRVVGKIERDYYTLEKVLIESEPNYFVPLNLYLPKGKPLPAPGVCITMGHATEGKGYPEYHGFALGLVRKGYVACAFDPMGQGERIEYLEPPVEVGPRGGPVGQHHYLMRPSYLVGRTLSGLRTWDGVRVVDYLLTRPEIDPQRIAVGGNSGGGQMTLLITACHPQVACCAAAHPGGSQENTYLRGQWLMDLRIISLIPPRPCRWIVGDQSGEEAGHRSRYDHLQRFYDLLGCPEAQDFVLVEGGHDLLRPKREAAYEWYNRWLNMPQAGKEEDELEPLKAEELWVTPTGQVHTSLGGETGQTINARLMRAMAPERPDPAADEGERRKFLEERRQRVLRRIGLEVQAEREPPKVRPAGDYPHPRLTIEKLVIESEPGVDLPSLLITPREDARGPVLIHAAELGKPRLFDEAALPFRLALAGCRVLSVDVRGMGELDTEGGKRGPVSDYDPIQWERDSVAINAAGAGRTVLAQRAFDLIRCVDYLRSREDTADMPVVLVGERLGGSWGLAAAVADGRVAAVATVETLASYRLIIDNQWNNLREYFWVPGALADYDLSDLPALIAPRPVALINAVDPMVKVMDAAAIRPEYAWSAKYYEAAGAGENLKIVSPATGAEVVEAIGGLR